MTTIPQTCPRGYAVPRAAVRGHSSSHAGLLPVRHIPKSPTSAAALPLEGCQGGPPHNAWPPTSVQLQPAPQAGKQALMDLVHAVMGGHSDRAAAAHWAGPWLSG